MKTIPTIRKVSDLYNDLCSRGGGKENLSELESFVLMYSPGPYRWLQAWQFRRQLLAVMNEGLATPPSDEKFINFINKWIRPASQSTASIILSDAVIDWKKASRMRKGGSYA